MSKLTDTQLIVLSNAAACENGAANVPASLNKAAASKVASSLVGRKLMREVLAKPGMPIWHQDAKGRDVALLITRLGKDAIGVVEEADDQEEVAASGTPLKIKTGKAAAAERKGAGVSTTPAHPQPRDGSKQAAIIAMLQKRSGATLEKMMEATGWLPHSTRAALTGLRKRGFEIERFKDGDVTAYRIVGTYKAAA